MPLWLVHVPHGVYTADDKQAFATSVTNLYSDTVRLPKFYVNVVFHELTEDNFYIGGQPRDNFVRITIDHIARKLTPEKRQWWMEKIAECVAPWISDRGLDWEVNVDETPRDLWTVQGIIPPEAGSDEEQRWLQKNKPFNTPDDRSDATA